MNKFKISSNFMEGKIWIPERKEQYFQDALSVLNKQPEFAGFRVTKLNHMIFSREPPTLFPENEFV